MQKLPNEADRHIGKRIRLRRIALGMSQEKLAGALGLTFQQIQKYEKGINRIGAGRLHEIGMILGVDVTYFFHGLLECTALTNANDNALDMVASTPHGAKLIELFASVEDSNIQRSIVRLVEAVLEAKQAVRS
ncbi:helix-turn-helix domain-containing protein [Microvirga sp. CF3016]|uniref:helix-turn-helix domain-containing protein n=1 Tax=Microvirga sp. CF3016 TaxID=3110181 RepID=UPI002E77336F|nr:helix-turn-helix transcriptional regulator [Microvirga sp. CF3016]MEE1612081.1 helix-turn-helix transcriptional regulator [Microvirga sp. CF3016]